MPWFLTLSSMIGMYKTKVIGSMCVNTNGLPADIIFQGTFNSHKSRKLYRIKV